MFALAEIGEALKKKLGFEDLAIIFKYHNEALKDELLSLVGIQYNRYKFAVTKISAKDLDINSGKEDRDTIINQINELNISDINDVSMESINILYTHTSDQQLVENLSKKLVGEDYEILYGSVSNLHDAGTDLELEDSQDFVLNALVCDAGGVISVVDYQIQCSRYSFTNGYAGYDSVLYGEKGKNYKVNKNTERKVGNIIEGYKQSVEDYNKYKQQING